jgi:hypothetical protein
MSDAPMARVRITRVLMAVAAMTAALAPRAARAQANTAETLTNAVKLYEDLQVERAVVLLRQVVSPSSPYEVSREQRVQAYKYLGAALAVLGQRDSAVVYLRAAVERDPFVDMDAQTFSAAEREALATARLRTFAVAVRPIRPDTLDPRTERTTFALFVTHGATLHVELRGAGAGATEHDTAILVDGDVSGARDVAWNGVLGDGRMAPTGRYALVARGRSAITGGEASALTWLDVRHDRPVLEDSLPPIPATELLPERHTRAAAGRELLRGLSVAAAAIVTQSIVTDHRLGGGGGYAATLGVAGGTAGAYAFVMRRRHVEIPANIAENRRRQAERAAHNADVARRNAERVEQTRLVILPAAGVAP